jgi:PAS domain S-box-containing protein
MPGYNNKYTPKNKFTFLSQGGEMGALIYAKDWSQNAAGAIESWPQSLQTTLGIILHSRFPMFLWWGPQLISFYNDAYRASLGENGKHPKILGKPAKEAWPEIWDLIKPRIDQVLSGNGATWNEEMLVPIFRNGKIEDVYWTSSYSPVADETGEIAGVLVTCMEVTNSVSLKRSLAASENKFKNLVMYSPTAITILRGPELTIELANEKMLKTIWDKKEEDVIGKNLLDVFPELKKQELATLLNQVFKTGKAVKQYECVAEIKTAAGLKKIYLDFELNPLFENDGSISGIIFTAFDLSEKMRAKAKIEEAEERLRLAVEASEMAIWEIDLHTDGVKYSDRLLEIFGHKTPKKLTLREIRRQIYPSDRNGTVKKAFADALQTGYYRYEARIVKPDKTIVRVRTRGKLFYDENGQPVKIIGTLRDVTEDEKTQQALERSERRLRKLILNAPVAIGILNGPDYVVEIMNELALKLMGKTREQMMNKPVLDVITELDPQSTKSLLDNVYNTGKPFSASEFPVTLNRYGKMESVYINFEYLPLMNSQEKVYGIMVVGIDITEQVLARRKVEESEARFRLLANSMPQFVWSADGNGNVNYFNQAFFDYTGFTNEQILNGGWIEMVHPDDRNENLKKWKESTDAGKDYIFEQRFRRYDGTYRWQLSRAVPFTDDTGNIQQWIGTSTDIQNIKEQEEQKDIFISIASHELKTPLTSLKGYVQILQSMYEKSEDAVLVNSLNRMDRQIAKLTALISDLLDVSKIKTGSLTFHKEEFEMNSLIKELVEEMEMIHPDHKIFFENDAKFFVYADKDRIGQVLINLINNAIKYSPGKGSILIKSTTDQNNLMVSVKDEGIGIDKDYQEKIFERFYRVEGKSEKTFPGFGIGLFIASEIIKRHSGNIGVSSNRGKGSRFYFSLPLHEKAD